MTCPSRIDKEGEGNSSCGNDRGSVHARPVSTNSRTNLERTPPWTAQFTPTAMTRVPRITTFSVEVACCPSYKVFDPPAVQVT